MNVTDEKSRIRSKIRYGSADLDPDPYPYQNVKDSQHWLQMRVVSSDQGTIYHRNTLINKPFEMVSKLAQENLETGFTKKNLTKKKSFLQLCCSLRVVSKEPFAIGTF
jgi:hypothetical protein